MSRAPEYFNPSQIHALIELTPNTEAFLDTCAVMGLDEVTSTVTELLIEGGDVFDISVMFPEWSLEKRHIEQVLVCIVVACARLGHPVEEIARKLGRTRIEVVSLLAKYFRGCLDRPVGTSKIDLRIRSLPFESDPIRCPYCRCYVQAPCLSCYLNRG